MLRFSWLKSWKALILNFLTFHKTLIGTQLYRQDKNRHPRHIHSPSSRFADTLNIFRVVNRYGTWWTMEHDEPSTLLPIININYNNFQMMVFGRSCLWSPQYTLLCKNHNNSTTCYLLEQNTLRSASPITESNKVNLPFSMMIWYLLHITISLNL